MADGSFQKILLTDKPERLLTFTLQKGHEGGLAYEKLFGEYEDPVKAARLAYFSSVNCVV